nr:hypothetical protein [Actinomycetota bacterium]
MEGPATVTLRTPTDEELKPFFNTGAAAFGGEIKEEDIPRWRSVFDLDRLIWAFDGELPVATAAAHTF